MEPVDSLKLQAHAYAYSTQFLKGILKVLTDMHTKEMSLPDAEKYVKDLAADMKLFDDFLKNASKI